MLKESRAARIALIVLVGLGTPLLLPRLEWRWYLGVNAPLTFGAICWDWLITRQIDRLRRSWPDRPARPFTESVQLWPATADVVGNPCKLPAELIPAPPRYVLDLAIGESGFTVFTALVVDEDRNCYVRAFSELRPKRSFSTITVKRTETGAEVIVRADDRYTPRQLPDEELIPVAALYVDLAP